MTLSAAAKTQLNQWYTEKPVFALMGEYSAGKSTLLNFLLGQKALPTKVTATNLPSIWLTYGDTREAMGLTHAGELVDVDMGSLGEAVREEYVLIRLSVPSEFLRNINIIDTPGISDPKLVKGSLEFLGDYCDFVVWCSAANQAWRQSEKAAWLAFSPRLRTTSLLALTRADKLRKATDLAKVIKRCEQETASLFREIAPLQTTKAAAVAKDGRTDDENGPWVTSGGAGFMACLEAAMKRAGAACEERAPVAPPLDAAPNAKVTPKVKGGSAGKTLDTQPDAQPDAESAQSSVDAAFVAGLGRLKTPYTRPQINAFLRKMRKQIEGDTRLSEQHRDVLLLCLESDKRSDLGEFIAQARSELADFSEGPWLRLGPEVSK